jgi:hypothetical protein
VAAGDEARARNEALKGAVNERIYDISDAFTETTGIGGWICECDDLACSTHITATPADYDRVRANPRWFMVLAEHVSRDIERIVERREGFVIVEKFGKAGEAAEEVDARGE